MPATLRQIDIAQIKSKIANERLPIRERCDLCVLLLELYKSWRNIRFVNSFIWKHRPKAKSGAVRELFEKLTRDRILEYRAQVRQKSKVPAPTATPPPGAVGTAPGSDGNDYYVDATGNILGRAPKAQ